MYKILVKSRHDSHAVLRKKLPSLLFLGVVRFGSITKVSGAVECNTVAAIKTAMDKRKMKQAFDSYNVSHAAWADWGDSEKITELGFPIIAKNPLGSGGTGVYLLRNKKQYNAWVKARTHNNYIFEKFHDYGHEFRLNCTQNKCIIATRKVLKPGETKQTWKKGGDNCVWLGEHNEKFEKPNNWDDIVKQACLAVKACGLDIGGVDVKVQKNYDKDGNFREAPKFFVIEVNSAPSTWGNKTERAYLKAIPEILLYKRKLINSLQ